jgi:putative ABC transport system permease protein
MFRDHVKLAVKNLRHRLSRSLLTLLGIAIGIMAIISLMGLGEGMQQAVAGELSSLSDIIIVSAGGDMFSMFSGGSSGEYFTERDISDIERVQGIRDVTTQLTGTALAEYNGKTTIVSLTGMEVLVMQLQYADTSLEAGSFLHEGDQNKIMIGYGLAHDTFDADISVGSRIKINGQKFFVSGIFSKQGGMGTVSSDTLLLMDIRDFKSLTGQSNISLIYLRVNDVNDAESIASTVEDVINENHGRKDFATATTMTSVLETVQSIMGLLQLVLVAIASIALVVASIGIMNTMLTSVMERTREIGIMKAIGATNKDIMSIFIFEGILVSSIGGICGIILGVFGSQGLTLILNNYFMTMSGSGLTPVITIMSVVLAVAVSIIVGVLSSLYPAWKAARMSPIEAVRYE